MWNYPRWQTLAAPVFNWCTNPCASSMKNDLSANISNTKDIFFDSAIISCWNCSRDTLQRTPCYILFLKTQFAKNQFLFVGWLRLVYNSAVSNYAKKYGWYLQCDIAQIEISLISHIFRRIYLNIIGKSI